MATKQDEIVYKGHKINTFKTNKEVKVNGKWQSVEVTIYSCGTDGHVCQSLDAMYSHIDKYLQPAGSNQK